MYKITLLLKDYSTMKQRFGKGTMKYIHWPYTKKNVSTRIVSICYLSKKIILWWPTVKKKHNMPDLFSVFVVRCKDSYVY